MGQKSSNLRILLRLLAWRCFAPCALAGWLFLRTGTAAAQSHNVGNDTARILSLENAWNGAEMNHDVRSLSLLIADSFVYTDSDGSFMDRNQWLTQIRNETDQYEQLANVSLTVLIYENAAVVTGEYREKIQIKGKPVLRSGRFTDTWIRRNGEWKCVASQATLISH